MHFVGFFCCTYVHGKFYINATRILERERKSEERRRSVLVPILKNMGDVQSFCNNSGKKLMSHTSYNEVMEKRGGSWTKCRSKYL